MMGIRILGIRVDTGKYFLLNAGVESSVWAIQSGRWNDGGIWDDSQTWQDGSTWVILGGQWNDSGIWDDSQTWND